MYKKNRSLLLAIIMLVSSSPLYSCGGNKKTEVPAGAPKTENTVGTDVKTDETGSNGVDYGSLELTMESTGAADDVPTQTMTYMKEYIEEKLGGVVVVNMSPSFQLGAAMDQLETTGQGSIDLFLEANFMTSSGVTEAKVGSLTFTYTSKEDHRKINESRLCKGWRDKFCELNSIRVIANNWYRSDTALVPSREIHTVEDIRGLKARVPQVDITMESFSEVDMNPAPIAYNESLLALRQGVMGTIWRMEGAAYTMGFYEMTQYLIKLDSYLNSMYVYMNNDLYNNITGVQRDLIVEVALEARKYYLELADGALVTNVIKMKEPGIEVVSLPPEGVVKLQASMGAMAGKYETAGKWPVGTYDKILEILGE